MAAAVAVSTVVDLIRMEYSMNSIGCGGNVFEEQSALFSRDVHQFGNMILVGHDDTARMALLLEEDPLLKTLTVSERYLWAMKMLNNRLGK